MLSAAQLLDELMGRDRNLAPDEKRSNVRWDNESVCRYYLCGFCPAELFTNTRSDLGPCEKIHDENLRKLYEKSSRFMKEGYERDFLRYLQSLLAEVERRIRRGHARLALSQAQQNAGGPGPSGKNEEKVKVLTEKIEDLVVQIEELGSEGRVEEAQGMMKLVEQLKEEREMLSSTPSTIESFAAQEKQMEVCEVCGAFLIVGDAQSRVDDHLMGKQHMGYAKIKSTVEELKTRNGADPVTIGGLGAETGIGNVNAAGATTERGGAVVSALTENVAPAVATGGGRAAQSASLTATEAAARTEKKTGTGIEKETETKEGRKTKSGHQKTKTIQRQRRRAALRKKVMQPPSKLRRSRNPCRPRLPPPPLCLTASKSSSNLKVTLSPIKTDLIGPQIRLRGSWNILWRKKLKSTPTFTLNLTPLPINKVNHKCVGVI
ncbi:hypothetical protein XENOCAPTIV_000072 [Xenoophorus captivus]|uniref:LUC7-like 3 pre-mRNA splicing factor n=1 Tax=Xenoophorus captivus TaxID=1517983 RepID=A0ABV0R2W9_9TELE